MKTQNLFLGLLKLLSKLSGKHVFYVNKNYVKSGNTAIKSKEGFWICGDVFDQSDIAYGFTNNGAIEEFDTFLTKKILTRLKQLYPERALSFFDVGANEGPYTLLAASLGSVEVNSFEPIHQYASNLEESCRINGFSRVTVHRYALSDEESEKDFFLAGTGSTLNKDFINNPGEKIKVKLKKLDNITKGSNILKPDFIKIDVEGHEYNVILGANKTISTSKPVLFIEIAKNLDNLKRSFINENYAKIFNELDSLGYVCYLTHNSKIKEYDASKMLNGTHMFLFLHKEKHAPLINQLIDTLCE
jgi:FkbM family methyltransferase